MSKKNRDFSVMLEKSLFLKKAQFHISDDVLVRFVDN
jgi:hypothetical protein